MGRQLRLGVLLAVPLAACPLLASPLEPAAAASPSRTVVLKDVKGKTVGRVTLTDTAHGLLLKGSLKGLSQGAHAFHFHEVGRCEPPFKSAGGHLNPAHKAHGLLAADGLHAGDLPNLRVPKNGKLDFEVFAAELTLADGPNTVLDADGTALVVHAHADDYRTQPSGDSGDRIACGVISH